MEQMVNVFVMGKKYEVPASLTIMKALEYAGYKLVRGCGWGNGFFGVLGVYFLITFRPCVQALVQALKPMSEKISG